MKELVNKLLEENQQLRMMIEHLRIENYQCRIKNQAFMDYFEEHNKNFEFYEGVIKVIDMKRKEENNE